MPGKFKSSKRAGRPSRETQLTRNSIATAAMEMIDREGLGQFSMRRLGQHLGVEAMALYNHFDDKEAILDEVASLTLMQVKLPKPQGSWQTRIKALCFSVRQLALNHPTLFRLSMSRPFSPDTALPLVEGALEILAHAGLDVKQQANAYHTLFLYARGFSLWEIDEFGISSKAELANIGRKVDTYPRVSKVMPLIFSPKRNEQFEAGLDLIIRGIVQ